MPTSHWVFTSIDDTYAGDTVLANMDIAIPATATLHRFLVRGVRITGFSQGNNPNRVVPLSLVMTVDIVSGAYSPRNIFRTSRAIPMYVTAVQTSISPDKEYTQYVLAGDNECSINEKTAYGTSSGPGFTMRLKPSIVAPPGSLPFPVGRVAIEFRALYSTP